MSKKRKIIYVLSSIGIIGIIGAASASYAMGTGGANIWSILTDEQKAQVKIMQEEKKQEMEKMQTAIEQGDYTTWKEIIESQPKMTDYINEGNFAQFSEMHNLMKEGNMEEAQKIRDELELPDRGMGMRGMGMHGGMMGEFGGRQHKGMETQNK